MMMNPVLRREVKTALRTWRIFWALAIYVGIMALATGLAVYGMMFGSYNYSFDPKDMTFVYVMLCAMEMVLVMIATPALAASSISGERERQTLDLLLVTKMSAFSIVLGKLMASLSVLMLMIVAALPVFAIVFYFGSVSILSLFGILAFVIVTACTVGAVSIFFSCIFKRTVLSVLAVYLVFAILCFGTLIACAMHQNIYWQMHEEYPSILSVVTILAANPGVGFFSLIDTQTGMDVTDTFMNFYSYVGTLGTQERVGEWMATHLWLVNMVVDVLITILFLWLSTIMIRRTKKK